MAGGVSRDQHFCLFNLKWAARFSMQKGWGWMRWKPEERFQTSQNSAATGVEFNRIRLNFPHTVSSSSGANLRTDGSWIDRRRETIESVDSALTRTG